MTASPCSTESVVGSGDETVAGEITAPEERVVRIKFGDALARGEKDEDEDTEAAEDLLDITLEDRDLVMAAPPSGTIIRVATADKARRAMDLEFEHDFK